MTRSGLSRYEERSENWHIRDMLRDALSRHTPQTSTQLFRRVTDEYGSIGERRLWSHLAWLIKRGIAKRVGRPRATMVTEDRGYIRGNGVETAEDAASRKACELAVNGCCMICGEQTEADRPWWMLARCRRCYYVHSAELSVARRLAYIAVGDCARGCGARARPGRRECGVCAQQQCKRRAS